MSVWATSSGVKGTALHFGPFSLTSVQLDSALLSRQMGCLLSLVHISSPILSFWCVFGIKFIFFLSPLADLKFLTATLPTRVLWEAFLSSSSCICVFVGNFWVSFLCQAFLFLLGESRGSISSGWIMNKREIKLDSYLHAFCGPHMSYLPRLLWTLFLMWKMGLMFTSWEFAWRHLIFSLVILDNDNVEDLPERMGCG